MAEAPAQPADDGTPDNAADLLHERERELAYREALLRSQWEASPDGILIVDAEGRVVSVNRQFLTLWKLPEGLLEEGRSDEEALDSVLHQLADPQEFLDKIAWLNDNPGARTRDEVHFRDGRVLERWSTPVTGPGGIDYGRGWYFRDITERKRVEAELARHAEERARLAELERFLFATSHSLLTPLRTIVSYAQLLERRAGDGLDEDARDFLTYLLSGAHQLVDVVAGLRSYAELSSRPSRVEEVDATLVLKAALAELETERDQADADVTFGFLPLVQGDADQLEALFVHLLSNAFRFRGASPPRVHVWAERTGHDWVFAIEDNGLGIPPEYHERVFGLFEQLEPYGDAGGTGIGLTISQRIVERHGGRIWVDSDGEHGTTVRFTLPAEPPRDRSYRASAPWSTGSATPDTPAAASESR